MQPTFFPPIKSNDYKSTLEGVTIKGVSLHSFGHLMATVAVRGRGLAVKDTYKIALKMKVILGFTLVQAVAYHI